MNCINEILPKEIFLKIFTYFKLKDLKNLRQVDDFFSIIASNIIFENYYYNYRKIFNETYIHSNIFNLKSVEITMFQKKFKNTNILKTFTSLKKLNCTYNPYYSYLKFNDNIDDIMIDIPINLTSFIFPCGYNKDIIFNTFPNNLLHLEMQYYLFVEIQNIIPKSIKYLKLTNGVNRLCFDDINLNLITPNLETLVLCNMHNIPLNKLKITNLEIIYGIDSLSFGDKRKFVIPTSVEYLAVSCTHFTFRVDDPINIDYLQNLHSGLKHFVLHCPNINTLYEKHFIPSTVEELELKFFSGGDYNSEFKLSSNILPSSLKKLKLFNFDESLNKCILPKNLKELSVKNFDSPLHES